MALKRARAQAEPSHPRDLASALNLGPKSAAMLLAAGIDSLAKLHKLGSVAAYAKVKQTDAAASLNLLWALEGALTRTHWRVVAKERRTALLFALDDLANGTGLGPGRARRKRRARL